MDRMGRIKDLRFQISNLLIAFILPILSIPVNFFFVTRRYFSFSSSARSAS